MGSDADGAGTTVGGKGETTVKSQRETTCPSVLFAAIEEIYNGKDWCFLPGDVLGLIFFRE